MAKNNFILYKDYKPNIDILNDAQAGKLFKAIFAYVEDRTEPNFKDGMLKMAFNFIQTQLERDLEKYKIRIKANQDNGKKGGRPKNPKKPKKPSGFNNNPVKPKKGDNDYVYDNVYDYEYECDNKKLKELFYDFLKLRKKLKAVNSGTAIKKLLNKLKPFDDDIKMEMLNNSIMSSWKSVFELKTNGYITKQDKEKIEDDDKYTKYINKF